MRAAVEEDEDGTKHPLGEKNEEGKLAEEGMKRIAGWREATIKASLRRVDPSAGSVSKLGLRGVKVSSSSSILVGCNEGRKGAGSLTE